MTPLKSYGGDSESESDKVKQTLAGHRYQLLKARDSASDDAFDEENLKAKMDAQCAQCF